MGQAMDFDKLRKKRRRTQLIKRVSIIAAVLAVILVIMSLNNILINVNIINQMSDFFGGLGGSGYPVSVPGGVIRSTKGLDNDLVVLNDTNMYIYSNKGKELLNVQRMSDSTILLTGGSRTLTYDIGGTKFRIHSRSNLLLDGESEYALNMAAIGENGSHALVCSSKQYTTQITVFDSRFEQKFQWFSNELVTATGLSPKGDRLAAGTVGASGGLIQSSVFLFAFDQPQEIAKVSFSEELILNIQYTGEKQFGVLTDKGYYVLDDSGNTIGSYSLGGAQITDTAFYDGNLLLLCVNSESRTQTVLLIGPDGKERGAMNLTQTALDIEVDKQGVYLLTGEGIAAYDYTLNLQYTREVMGVSHIQSAGGTLYYFTSEEICVLERGSSSRRRGDLGEGTGTSEEGQ